MDYGITSWQDAVILAGSTVFGQIVSFLPNLFGAILIFILGWIIAGWLKSLAVKLFQVVRLAKAVEGTAIETFLKKAEWKGKIEEIIGNLVKWIIVLVFFIAAANILGLSAVSQVLNSILAYLPNVFSAALILLVGVLLAGLVEGLIKGAMGAIDVSTSRLLGKIASWMVMIFTVLAAISELRIAEKVINTLIIGAVATMTLGLGLAIGLGAKDLVKELLSEWYGKVRRDLKKKD